MSFQSNPLLHCIFIIFYFYVKSMTIKYDQIAWSGALIRQLVNLVDEIEEKKVFTKNLISFF